MVKTTDINGVRSKSKALLRAVPVKAVPGYEFLAQHPFTAYTTVGLPDVGLLDLSDEDACLQWMHSLNRMIDDSSLDQIFSMINDPWNLTWLSLVKPHLSNADFSEYLAVSWINEENPNMDPQVSTSTAIKWFKQADKKRLMDDEDYTYWDNLPDKVTLYRGVSVGRKKLGLSWTDSEDVARWFQDRFAHGGKKGILLKVTVKKEHCLCYFNTRNEREIVLDVNAVRDNISVVA